MKGEVVSSILTGSTIFRRNAALGYTPWRYALAAQTPRRKCVTGLVSAFVACDFHD